MKNVLRSMTLSFALFSASVAQADLGYKWVSLNEEQVQAVANKCGQLNSAALGGISAAGGAAMILPITTAARNIMNIGGPGFGGGAGAIAMSPVSSLAITLVGFPAMQTAMIGLNALSMGIEKLYSHFNPPELYLLLSEQQEGRPGLQTAKLTNMADNLQIDVNIALGVLNMAAIKGQVCGEDASTLAEFRSEIEAQQTKAISQQFKVEAK